MIEVKIHPLGNNNNRYRFVVIAARYRGEWILVKHCERETWEIPGGHIEEGESPDDAAKRELFEETGAQIFTVSAICDYSVKINGKEGISRLYFAEVEKLGSLPDSEICCIDFFDHLPDKLTYPKIQPILLNEVIKSQKKAV